MYSILFLSLFCSGDFVIRDGSAGHPAIAFDGSNFMVVWTQGGSVNGARVTTTGDVLDPNGKLFYNNPAIPPSNYCADPDIAFGDDNYLVVSGGHC